MHKVTRGPLDSRRILTSFIKFLFLGIPQHNLVVEFTALSHKIIIRDAEKKVNGKNTIFEGTNKKQS